MTAEPDAAQERTSYAYKPSLVGTGWHFTLTDDGILWSAGPRSGHVPYANVQRMRMAYKPVGMQSHRFITEVWASGTPKLTVISTSWKSLVEMERQDEKYSAFVEELHRRVAAAGVTPRCEQGNHPVLYWPAFAVATVITLGLAFLVVRALQAGSTAGALFIVAFIALFLWRGGKFLRINRPALYRIEAPPRELLPV